MRQLSCLFVFLISGMVVFGQNTLQITSSDQYIFRQKCTIEYADRSTSIADIELLESSKTEEMDEKNQHERYTHNLYQNTVNDESSFKHVTTSEPIRSTAMNQHNNANGTPKDSTLQKKRDKLRFDPTFELGMRDAKKYYRIRNHWVTQNENNPNNHLLTEDRAYQSGYAWIVQKKHKNLKLLIIALSIPVVFFLLLLALLSGESGGFWF